MLVFVNSSINRVRFSNTAIQGHLKQGPVDHDKVAENVDCKGVVQFTVLVNLGNITYLPPRTFISTTSVRFKFSFHVSFFMLNMYNPHHTNILGAIT